MYLWLFRGVFGGFGCSRKVVLCKIGCPLMSTGSFMLVLGDECLLCLMLDLPMVMVTLITEVYNTQ